MDYLRDYCDYKLEKCKLKAQEIEKFISIKNQFQDSWTGFCVDSNKSTNEISVRENV